MDKGEVISASRGMKFPPEADKATGRFLTSEGNMSIKESLYLILMTQKTERKSNPQFGTETLSYTFGEMSPTVLHMMEYRLEEELAAQEPRIRDVRVKVVRKDTEEFLYIYIDYLIEETGAKERQIYTFVPDGGKVGAYEEGSI